MARPHAEVSTSAADFLRRLTVEHARFLDALADARRSLDPADGQLVAAAGLQARLTQQFLDAQRSILRRRGEIDAEVARIDRAAPMVPGVDQLASMIAAAAALSEQRADALQRQLRALLDDWWRAETDEAIAAIDDAQARAAMRRHMTRDRCGALPPPVATAAADPWAQCAPAAAHDAPEAVAAHDGLEDLIAELLAELDEPVPDPSGGAPGWAAPSGVPVMTAEPMVPPPAPLAGQEAFDRFWGDGAAHGAPARHRWIAVQILPPLAAVVAVLTVALAWIG